MPESGLTAGRLPSLLRRGKLKIAVIGLGRIGLPTAAVFALAGARVTGVDIEAGLVSDTNAGHCRFVDEPGLAEMVKKTVANGRLKATLEPDKAIAEADFVVVCVPTPVDQTKTPDYTAVLRVSHTIGRSLRRGTVVIIESTIGPGIAEEMVKPIIEKESGLKAGVGFGLVCCPERSDPGRIIANMSSVPRIVGGMTKRATELVATLYEVGLGVKAIRMSSPKTANAVKLTENLFRDVNIALANEFALLYEQIGIDSIEVINACASKYNFMPHYPGPGVGGPCLVGDEFVYLLDAKGLHVTRVRDYVSELDREGLLEREFLKGASILRPRCEVSALSFDGTRTIFDRVMWFSVRHYEGKVVGVQLSSNRQLTVTPDHPMLTLGGNGFLLKRASSLQVGDEIPVSKNYSPPFSDTTTIDLIEELVQSGRVPLSAVKVKPSNFKFREHLDLIGEALRDIDVPPGNREDFYRWNYLTLGTYLKLEAKFPSLIPRDRVRLYTGRGRTCLTPAVFQKDPDFWRFIGYYLSEGCRYSERTKSGARVRIKISFGAHENYLVDDCRSILDNWGIRYSEEIRDGSHSLKFSSRIFGLLLDVLGCGNNSYDKKLPSQIFASSQANVAALLQGLFRGDGWIEERKKQQAVIVGYATVSPELFQGTLLLLQRFGIIPVCRQIVAKKSTVPALALLISRYEDLKTLQQEVGGNSRLTAALLQHPKMIKKSPALTSYGSFATAFVKSLDEADFEGEVYNLEVERYHTFVSSFGIVTHNCLPSNSYYLISEAVRAGNIPYLIRMAREINDRMPDHVVELASEALNEAGKTIRGSRIAILGVAYKPDIKDLQLTPLERVVSRLTEMGAEISIYDPMFKGEKVFGLRVSKGVESAVRGVDCIIIGTGHSEFKNLDPSNLARLVRKKAALVDTRNVVSPEEAVGNGFSYRGVGRTGPRREVRQLWPR